MAKCMHSDDNREIRKLGLINMILNEETYEEILKKTRDVDPMI